MKTMEASHMHKAGMWELTQELQGLNAPCFLTEAKHLPSVQAFKEYVNMECLSRRAA